MNQMERVCPRCGRCYSDPPALSRADNKTEICPDCGTKEAMMAFEEYRQRELIKRRTRERLEAMKEAERRNEERIRHYLENDDGSK